MLSSFTIQNFKSYRDATLKLAPLTVLIGANASGKSNAIEGLRLLSWIIERFVKEHPGPEQRATIAPPDRKETSTTGP